MKLEDLRSELKREVEPKRRGEKTAYAKCSQCDANANELFQVEFGKSIWVCPGCKAKAIFRVKRKELIKFGRHGS